MEENKNDPFSNTFIVFLLYKLLTFFIYLFITQSIASSGAVFLDFIIYAIIVGLMYSGRYILKWVLLAFFVYTLFNIFNNIINIKIISKTDIFVLIDIIITAGFFVLNGYFLLFNNKVNKILKNLEKKRLKQKLKNY